MAILGGADEVVIRAVHPLDHRLEARHVTLDQFTRGQPFARGGLLDLLPVLVGAGQEIDVIPVEPLEARNRVGRDRFIGVTDMRHAVRIGDRRGDIEAAARVGLWHRRTDVKLWRRRKLWAGRGLWREHRSRSGGELALGCYRGNRSRRHRGLRRPRFCFFGCFFGDRSGFTSRRRLARRRLLSGTSLLRPGCFLAAGPDLRFFLRRPLLGRFLLGGGSLGGCPFGRSRTLALARALTLAELLRAPAFFFAVLRCFDFDVFAMDHSAVSICGSDKMAASRAVRRTSKVRAISRVRHRQGGRMS